MKKVQSKVKQDIIFNDQEIQNDFVFTGPSKIEIKSSVDGIKNYCQLTEQKWIWTYGGVEITINWDLYKFNNNLKNIIKTVLCSRFYKVSPRTINTIDLRFVRFLQVSNYGDSFPWLNKSSLLVMIAELLVFERNALYGLKAFYRFGIANNINGFDNDMLAIIEDSKEPQRNQQYQKVLLNEINSISPEDENLIIENLNQPVDILNYVAFRNDVIFHLALELAPRPIQIHSLSIEDAEVVLSSSGAEKYYSVWLPMAKKRNKFSMEKRSRKITKSLGEKLTLLINEGNRLHPFTTPLSPVFMNPRKIKEHDDTIARLNTTEISKIITNKMKSFGFSKGDGAIFLRHHLAQSLADQGASAETIAEILGHNSTVPARAYIAATPTIAEIKTRALGKNETFKKIMKMLLTGEVIKKEDVKNERWVKGMVGSRYIGGIGACGLNTNTECPKNPVYSCYTCKKFNPFKDGVHSEVKEMLQKEAQYFIDISEKGLSLESNRTITQLERTIEAVDAVIEQISIQN